MGAGHYGQLISTLKVPELILGKLLPIFIGFIDVLFSVLLRFSLRSL
jgi:hypothetical protein